MSNRHFSLTMSVRDYECDMQGIVNNGVYQNYLEHTRHEYLKELGLDFAEYTRQGIHLVVVRAELDYRMALASGDRFVVTLEMVRESRVKLAFIQQIHREGDNARVMDARIIVTAINPNGRLALPPELDALRPMPR